ncbi:TXND3 protein, partial [Polyodon spathula]|nr:TXND3 protein [Polyodon spathula]
LTVVDVYQQWCGPCRAVVSLFRKIKNELGDDLLHFATAETDGIDSLERYRGKCEPTFLFYGGGDLVAVVRGANAPLLQKTVLEQLTAEKKVLEQGTERKVIQDEGLVKEEEEEVIEKEESDEDVLVPDSKAYTVAIIKPDAVAHGKANEIIMKIQEAGFEILAHEERTLSESEARDFYQHKTDELCFEELVQFMASGPSHVLVVSKPEGTDDVIPAWREFIGPTDVEVAKREKPDSLRAQYGTETLFNAVHGSDNSEQASKELAFFFPNFKTSSEGEQLEEAAVERTLALIRPDILKDRKEEILLRIQEAGFTIAMQKEVMLSEQQVRELYRQHVEEDYFPALLNSMTSGPVLAVALAKKGAVEYWRNILGPKDVTRAKEEAPESFRAQFAAESVPINQLHGSATCEEAARELSFFFPKEQTLAVIKPDTLEEHKGEILEQVQAEGFTISQMKETVLSREMAEEFYKEHRGKPFFNQLVDYMCR